MTEINSALHKFNRHRTGYDFDILVKQLPELESKIVVKSDGLKTIDFSDANSVYLLNKALLSAHYNISYWKLPAGYLCPGVPGRADYLLYIAQLAGDRYPKGRSIRLLDIGTGSSIIYPLLANRIFNWTVVASEIDETAIRFAAENILNNELLEFIDIRKQQDVRSIFKDIIIAGEVYDFTVCNPPFYKSEKEAKKANQRKNKNLKNTNGSELNFGGRPHELWVEGGELRFLRMMIKESRNYSKQVFWFSSLISNKDNLTSLVDVCVKLGATEYKVIKMQHGKKKVHALAWTFLNDKFQKLWSDARWR